MKITPDSPLPWRVVNTPNSVSIENARGRRTFSSEQYYPWVTEEDMPYIVHAANAYPNLVAALWKARDATDYTEQHADIDKLLGELGETTRFLHGDQNETSGRSQPMKTADLEGALLDYWVAKAEGYAITWCNQHDDPNDLYYPNFYWSGNDLTGKRIVECMFQPSTNWSHGGPLIERERVGILPVQGTDFWTAGKVGTIVDLSKRSPTPLIAAMRAVVTSKYGEGVPDK